MAIRYLSGVNIDSNTLVVDSTNNRVGINTASPDYALDLGTSGTGNQIRARRIYANGTGTDSGYTLDSTLIFQGASNSFNITNPGSYPSVAFTINSSGNVGIGTTSPTRLLEISATNPQFSIKSTSATGFSELYFGDNTADNGWIGYAHNGDYMYFGTNGSEKMRINSGGDVAINTTDNASAKLRVIGNGAAGNSAIMADYGNTSVLGEVSMISYRNSAWHTLYVKETGSSATNAVLVEGTKPVIFNAGDVGIGTTSPSDKLTVSVGNVEGIRVQSSNSGFVEVGKTGGARWRWTNEYNSANLFELLVNDLSGSTPGQNVFTVNGVNGNIGIGTTSPSQKLHINGGNVAIDSSSDVSLIFAKSGASKYEWYLDNASNNFGLYDRGNTSWRFFVTNAGNVGIGTTSPDNKLQIGSTGSTGFSGNDIVIGNGTQVMAFYQSATISNWYTNTDFALLPAGAGAVGNLGVGTGSPTQRVHVSGNIRVTGAYYDSNNSAGSSGQVLSSTGSGTDWVSLSEITGVDGTGTANYVAKWSDTDTITNSSITDNGTTVTATVDRLNMNKQAGIYVFSKTVGASASSAFFSISNLHGAQAFRVTFVCSTSGYSVAKTYEVVHIYGTTPVYSKVVDSGPFGSEDFDVSFTNSNSDTGCTATVTNSSTTTAGNIVATVFLGGGAETITVTAL